MRYPDNLEVSLQILEALRAPREAILTIPERVDDIQTEADVASRFLSVRSVRTLVIVTSKVHSTRAKKVFAASLGPKVGLVIHPAPADPYDPERWWKDRTDRRQTEWEYAGLVRVWWRGLWRGVVGATAIPPPIAVQ
jgi:uncharacterized SAM-binding protein YcdF (DUF218 family)